MDNLNDFYLYAMVVEHGGFTRAEQALGIPKSRLSRRITQLESDLGVRLLQRSSRRFAVTDIGQSVYQRAQAMLTEAQEARDVVARLSSEPRGVVRVSVPEGVAQDQMPVLVPEFLSRYPHVRLQMLVSNRRFDVINENIDVALRVRNRLDNDGSLVMRSFGQTRALLVASPAYLAKHGRPVDPDDLKNHATLSADASDVRTVWELEGPEGDLRRIEITPAVMAFSFPLLRALVIQGQGITLLPESTCADQVRAGELEVVLPGWRLPQGIFHAVFASRRGMLPAVRVWIDFLAEKLPVMIEEVKLGCENGAAWCTSHPNGRQ